MFTGIVETVGTLAEVKPTGGGYRVRIKTPLSHSIAPGDSLAVAGVCLTAILVDGVSLTIAGLGEKQFDVQIIPFTWTATTLHTLRTGDRVNLECDMLGKYVVRAIEQAGLGLSRKPEGQ